MKKLLQQFESLSEEIKSQLESTKLEIESKSKEVREMEMFGKFDSSAINSFFNKPYTIVPRKDEEWFLVVPKFFDIQVGYLFKSDETYNIFLVNKYAHYLGGVPQEFERIFKFKRKLPAKVFDGVVLTGEENQDEVWNRYKKYLTGRLGKDRIKIKRGRQFDLIAALIKDGILPFVPKPVAPEHTREPIWKKKIPEIERRRGMEFFQDAFDRFKKTGAIGVYWAMGTGKTLFGLEALSSISVDDKPNVVISGNSVMLREQWKEKLELVSLPAQVEVHTYHSWHKLKDREFGLVIFDECHHLPANTFSKLSTLKADYRIGLCLDKNTKVLTPKGKIKMDELNVGDLVVSFNFETRECENKPILGKYNSRKERVVIRISTPKGIRKIVCSPEHKIFSAGDFVEAKDLNSGKTVMFMEGI